MRPRDDVVSVAGLRKLQKSFGMAWRGVGAFFFLRYSGRAANHC